MMILDGKTEDMLKQIDKEMQEAAVNLNFEKAAELRDKRLSIENLIQKQKMDSFSENDIDVIGIVKVLDRASVEIFSVRNSKMLNGENFIFKDLSSETEEELIETFIKQYYSAGNVPSKIMIKYELKEQELLKQWLQEISGKKNVEFKVPKKGEKMRFIEMAEKNANIALQNKTTAMEDEEILMDLMNLLKLDELPKRIESYDISNISGTDIVGGMVVFENAKPKRNEYRRLKIKTVNGQDDPACMREVLTRRLKYLCDLSLKSPYGDEPNLILMDGGISQIRVARNVINELGLDIPVFGMVKTDKHRTRAILDEEGKEYDISNNSRLFNFVTFLQDEVHETAIEYHRKLRDSKIRKSELDEIDGIGEKRKKALMDKFKSVKRMKDATIEELCEVDGISREIAIKIKNL